MVKLFGSKDHRDIHRLMRLVNTPMKVFLQLQLKLIQ